MANESEIRLGLSVRPVQAFLAATCCALAAYGVAFAGFPDNARSTQALLFLLVLCGLALLAGWCAASRIAVADGILLRRAGFLGPRLELSGKLRSVDINEKGRPYLDIVLTSGEPIRLRPGLLLPRTEKIAQLYRVRDLLAQRLKLEETG